MIGPSDIVGHDERTTSGLVDSYCGSKAMVADIFGAGVPRRKRRRCSIRGLL